MSDYCRSRREFLRSILPGRWLGAFVATAALLHLIAAWYNIGFLNSDEHYQIVEFAQYKLGYQSAGALAWEFAARIRPALQPWLAAGVIRLHHLAGLTSPFLMAFSLRLLSTLLALYVSLELCVRCLRTVTTRWAAQVALFLAFCLWIAPTAHGRFSSENWGGALLVGGLCLVLDAADTPVAGRLRAAGLAVLAGLVWSGAFYCRFQVGLAIAGAGGWLLVVRRPARLVVVALAASFALGCAANEALDRWLYGAWTFAPYRYFVVNLVQGKAATFGTGPPWMVAAYMAVVLIPPFSVALLALLAVGSWYARRDVLVWMTIPFVVVHAAVARKDPRFLIPLLYLVGPLFAVSVESLPLRVRAWLDVWRRGRWGRASVVTWCALDLVAVSVAIVMPVHDTSRLDRWLWDRRRGGPTVMYTIGKPPYDASDLTMNSFYLGGNVVLRPFATIDRLPARRRPVFVYYRGVQAPPTLGSSRCPPVLRTFPVWLAEIPLFGRFTNVGTATVCRLEAAR